MIPSLSSPSVKPCANGSAGADRVPGEGVDAVEHVRVAELRRGRVPDDAVEQRQELARHPLALGEREGQHAEVGGQVQQGRPRHLEDRGQLRAIEQVAGGDRRAQRAAGARLRPERVHVVGLVDLGVGGTGLHAGLRLRRPSRRRPASRPPCGCATSSIAALRCGLKIESAVQSSAVQTMITLPKPASLPPIDMKTTSICFHSSNESLLNWACLSPLCGSTAKFGVVEPLQARNATESPVGVSRELGVVGLGAERAGEARRPRGRRAVAEVRAVAVHVGPGHVAVAALAGDVGVAHDRGADRAVAVGVTAAVDLDQALDGLAADGELPAQDQGVRVGRDGQMQRRLVAAAAEGRGVRAARPRGLDRLEVEVRVGGLHDQGPAVVAAELLAVDDLQLRRVVVRALDDLGDRVVEHEPVALERRERDLLGTRRRAQQRALLAGRDGRRAAFRRARPRRRVPSGSSPNGVLRFGVP